MAIFSQVQTLHGRDRLKDVRLLETTRVKIAKRTTDLEFLKNCRDNQLVPQFAVIKHRLRNPRNEGLFKSMSLSLVKNEIKRTRAENPETF